MVKRHNGKLKHVPPHSEASGRIVAHPSTTRDRVPRHAGSVVITLRGYGSGVCDACFSRRPMS